MSAHIFTLFLDGPIPLGDEQFDDLADAMGAAGLLDTTFGIVDGVMSLECHREADTLEDAIFSVIAQVEGLGRGLTVKSVDQDPLVRATEIAERLDKSRQYINQLIKGERGPGSFPPPNRPEASPRRHRWRWLTVVQWLHDAGLIPNHLAQELLASEKTTGAVNAALSYRQYTDSLRVVKRVIYYTVIDGNNYDRELLELANCAVAGRDDGRISDADADKLFAAVKGRSEHTDVERATIQYIIDHYPLDPKAAEKLCSHPLGLTTPEERRRAVR